jgi:ParB family chromosome partitioning protein
MARSAKHGLGRGLDALLGPEPDSAPSPQEAASASAIFQMATSADSVVTLAVDAIDPNRGQPRQRFDEASLNDLAESIRSVGVIQPVIVKKNGSRYQIIAGERRWRAARIAGLKELPCIVRDWNEAKRLEVSLIENLQRDDLNPVEEALGVKSLMDQCGYTQEAASERLGKSRPAIANLLRLLNLPDKVLEMLREGKLSAGHARALVTLRSPDLQQRLANLAAAQGWSVRQMERICAQQQKDKPDKPRRKPEKNGECAELERMAREVFGTKAERTADTVRESSSCTITAGRSADIGRYWSFSAGRRCRPSFD